MDMLCRLPRFAPICGCKVIMQVGGLQLTLSAKVVSCLLVKLPLENLEREHHDA